MKDNEMSSAIEKRAEYYIANTFLFALISLLEF